MRLSEEQSQLVADNMGLAYVQALAWSKGRPWLAQEILDGAIDGLIVGALNFDESRGMRFSTLAWKTVRQGIIAALRKLRNGRSYEQVIDIEECDLLAIDPKLPDESPDFESIIGRLDARRRQVLRWRYRDGLTLEEVGQKLGLTKERVRQIQLSAERTLRDRTSDP